MSAELRSSARTTVAVWAASAIAVVALAAGLTVLSQRFGYDTEVIDMPVLPVVAMLVAAGLVFAAGVLRLVQHSSFVDARTLRVLLLIMIAAGLAARLILFASEPVLEDDYQRYLWDGAVTASGANPYASAPRDVIDAHGTHDLSALAANSGPVIKRINHPQLTTIYPPVAQAAFALAHSLKPWSLTAWRGVLLGCELAALGLLLALLNIAGRSPLWGAIYWWNPLVLKEVANSAHMDAVVVALVLLALFLAVTRRTVFASAALGFAVAAKLWPVVLLPLVLRPLLAEPRRLMAAMAVFVALACVALWPMLLSAHLQPSGLAAYAQTWSTNSALVPILQSAAASVLAALGLSSDLAPIAARGILATAIATITVLAVRAAIASPQDMLARAGFVVAAVVLLAPAQYPWYALWLVPLLCFAPRAPLLLMTATLPLYYATFHFAARETLESAQPILIALIWGPVWAALAYGFLRERGMPAGQRDTLSLLEER